MLGEYVSIWGEEKMATDNRGRRPLSDYAEASSAIADTVSDLSRIPLSDGPIGEAARYMCRAWAGTPTYQGLIQPLGISTACTPYLNSIGRGAPTYEPPFEGGQCPVLYQGTWVESGVNPFSGAPYSINTGGVRLGPISLEFGTRADGLPGYKFGTPGVGSFGSVAASSERHTLSDVVWVRQDGQPDTCGDPDGEFQPGSGYDGEGFGDTFVTNYNGNNYSVTVGIPVNIDGTVSIPVDIDFDGGNIGVDLGLGGGVPEVPPEGQGGVGDPVPSNPSGEGEPPEEDGSLCVGVIVSLFENSKGWGIVPGGGSNPIYPRVVGNVSLLCRPTDGSGGDFWSSNHRLYSNKECVVRPHSGLTVVRWRIKIVDDVAYTARPLYLEV